MPTRSEMLSMLGALYLQRESIDDAIAKIRRDIENNPLHHDAERPENPLSLSQRPIPEGQVVRPEDLPDGFRYLGTPQPARDTALFDPELAAAVADALAAVAEPLAEGPPAPTPGTPDALDSLGLPPDEVAMLRAKRRGEQLQATPIDADAPVKPYDVSEPYHGDREQQAQLEQRRRMEQNAAAGKPRVSPINSGGVNGQLSTRWKNTPSENGIRTRG